MSRLGLETFAFTSDSSDITCSDTWFSRSFLINSELASEERPASANAFSNLSRLDFDKLSLRSTSLTFSTVIGSPSNFLTISELTSEDKPASDSAASIFDTYPSASNFSLFADINAFLATPLAILSSKSLKIFMSRLGFATTTLSTFVVFSTSDSCLIVTSVSCSFRLPTSGRFFIASIY